MKKIFAFIFAAFFFCNSVFLGYASFSDVPEEHPFSRDIRYLEQLGIVQEDAFQPDQLVTREVFAKWVLKNAGFTREDYKPRAKLRFLDVKIKNNPYAPYIYRLADLGVVELGKKERLFRPKQSIGKIEALKWIFAVEGIPVPKIFDETQFPAKDIRPASKAAPLINKAINLGILQPGKIRPNEKVARGLAAHWLKTVKNSGPTLTVTIVPTTESDVIRNPKFDILAGAWNRIFQNYLRRDAVSRENLLYGAIEGMVKELGDKNSDFERPGDNALLESLSGKVEGIGAVIQMREDEVVVVAPISGSPAAKAGLLPNDVITAVDDEPVRGLKLTEVVARIKGKKGTQVKLTIRRGDKIKNFTITRDIVKIISAELKRTDDNIAIIALNDFGENTTAEFQGIVEDITKNQPKSMVIDLRNNPGGFLDTAMEIAGYFIKNGDKITIVKYHDREEPQNSSGNAELAAYKAVVLVNGGSASASEILAGALQDYGLAKVIGEKTFGKGTVQELSDFSDGSSLKLTVAEWLTPNGRSIEKNGIAPDIEVKLTEDDIKANRDPQMERALAELRM